MAPRKPPPVAPRRPPAAAPDPSADSQRAREEAFIRRENGAPADGRNHPQMVADGSAPRRARAPKGSRKLIERDGGRLVRRLQVYLAPDVAEALEAYARDNHHDLSHVVELAVRALTAAGRRRR